MKTAIKTIETKILGLIFLLVINTSLVFSQFYAEDVFDSKCALCHTIGEGVLKGPDLLGVRDRRPQDWLIKFIQSSNSMIKSGDPVAVELFNKYNKTEMQDWDYSESEIIDLLNYISSFGASTSGTASTGLDTGSMDSAQILMFKLEELLKYYNDKKKRRVTKEDIRKGEALFIGKLSFKNKAEACVNCHNVKESDTVNLNPSAFEIAESYDNNLKEVLIKPTSIVMREALKDKELTAVEVKYLSIYIDSIRNTGLIKVQKINWRKYIFLGVLLLIVFSFVDLKFKKLIKLRQVHYIIIFTAICYLSRETYIEASNLSFSTNYEPEQPIKFSHKTHAGDNKIDCLYCHGSAEYSKVAGIPSLNICMNCHKAIKKSKDFGKFEINKISAAIKSGIPVKWVKVHNVPDHVFFSHAQHVTVGKRECEECHGKVEEMQRVKQLENLSMGWCLECHRQTEIQSDSNEYYKAMISRHDKYKNADSLKLSVADFGGNECQKCHY